jgi:hypothetical protein
LRIPCPYCGLRGNDEFTYLGDASVRRPDPAGRDAAPAFHDTSICATIRPASTRRFRITAAAATPVARGHPQYLFCKNQRREIRRGQAVSGSHRLTQGGLIDARPR